MTRLTDLIGKELGTDGVARDRPGEDRWTRRGDRRSAVDPHDPVKAAEGPFGTTIAHGFLTLSLCVPLMTQALGPHRLPARRQLRRQQGALPGARPSGSRIRARFEVQSVEEVAGGEQGVVLATVEREGGEKPVCVAEPVLRMLR